MAWCQQGCKPLSEPMMVSLLMHICITRPQWVNDTTLFMKYLSQDYRLLDLCLKAYPALQINVILAEPLLVICIISTQNTNHQATATGIGRHNEAWKMANSLWMAFSNAFFLNNGLYLNQAFINFVPIDSKSAFVQVMAWCQTGDKLLLEQRTS